MLNYYLNKILRNTENLKGELGKEQEAYKEYLSGAWKSDERETKGNIINLKPVNQDVDSYVSGNECLFSMVADSGADNAYKKDTYFYVSDDDDFALVIDEKTISEDTSLTASLISESGRNVSGCILFCPETNKYYLCNSRNEIALSGYKNFNYRSFTFKLIFPAAKIFFSQPEDTSEVTAISSEPDIIVSRYSEKDEHIIIELETYCEIKALVLKSSKYTDFITMKNREILIPKALVDMKFELLVY